MIFWIGKMKIKYSIRLIKKSKDPRDVFDKWKSWSKLTLWHGAIEAGSVAPWAPWLAIAGVLNSALSLAYYGWIIRKMYFEGESEKRISEPKSIIAVMIFSVIFMVGFGVYPDPLIQFAQNAAPVIGIMP